MRTGHGHRDASFKRNSSNMPMLKAVSRSPVLLVAIAFIGVSTIWLLRSFGTRTCAPSWQTLPQNVHPRIALVSLSDAKANSNGTTQRRRFSGILEATRPHKEAYAKEHGYTFIDASDLLDRSRPPSWSKIRAVQAALKDHDWVMWIDADTIITNPDRRLEDLLPSDLQPHFIVTIDPGGFNAGMWIIRNSNWSLLFLARWWSMDSFVRKAAMVGKDSKSGDNDALKHMLAHMDRHEFAAHVGVAPQCAFNSYLWRSSARNWIRYLWDPKKVMQGLHQPGDFILHMAGVEDKMSVIQKWLGPAGAAQDGGS